MAGHGSPLRAAAPLCQARLRRWLAPLVALVLLLFFCAPARAEDMDELRLRLTWGGGAHRSWEGTIRVSSGKLADVIPLGLEADTPGSMRLLDESTLAIAPRFPRNYDGVDLLVTAPRDAKLIIDLAADGGDPLPTIQWRLETLAKVVQQANLDDQENRLVGQRSPGDRLPLDLPRDHLVFGPGEKFEFTVMPRPLDLSPNTGYLLNVALLPGRGGEELTSQDRDFKTDSAAAPQLEGIFALTLPNEEGVYDVRISLYPKRLTSPLVRGKPISERRVQLVVVDPALAPSRETTAWETALELDPAHPRWWEKMIRIPSIGRIPGMGQQTYGSAPATTRFHLDRTLVELAPDQWQAYPLPIGDVGRLHMLEVEFPNDLQQSLQISLVEPNAAGKVLPVGLDSGIDVAEPLPGTKGAVRVHRIPFWPQTKAPLVLLVNRSANLPAVYGKIRVQVGPTKLPPARLPPASHPQRMLAVSLDRPFFCENFGAAEALAGSTGHTRKDWVTFYQGASRLVDYLHNSGRNAAMICMAGEGSALYSSPLLEPTPQFDTGIYFESGQDPLRKDVAELLFRMFDRAGVQLIPLVKFTSPLVELEAERQDPDRAMGLVPIGPDGQPWLARHATHRGAGVHYNPLDPRVQEAMRRVAAELAERYGHHPSFGGLAVHLAPDSYTILPDEGYSLDDVTMARFSEETKTAVPGAGADRYAQRARFLLREGRAAWLDWRAGQLANLYQRMEADIARTHAGARLYLHTGELLTATTLQSALRPALPQPQQAQEALLQVGIDPQRLVGQGTMLILRPQRIVPSFLPGLELQEHFNQLWQPNSPLSAAAGSGVLFTHQPAPLRLSSFDQASPFGSEQTHTWFIPALTPAAASSRQRLVHSVAAFDAQTTIDAGWLLPLGQDDALRGVAAVYRRLPGETFQTATPRSKEDRTQPVVVRWLARGGKTYFYAANDSPWPVDLEIEFESAEIFRLVSYHPDKPGSLARQASRGTWSVQLDPFDLVGGELSSDDIKINTWRVALPAEAEAWLKQQIHESRLRAAALRNPLPREALANPSFELPPEGAAIPGWTSAVGAGVVAAVEPSQARTGTNSLRLASRRQGNLPPPVVWIRSEPIEPAVTGRISLVAWMKIADPKLQPKLRLAIEGKHNGKSFYRFANVGAPENGTPARPLGTQWAPYRFRLSLPAEGISELRLGFDLMGEGEVWIDDVQIFDLWFEDAEQSELLKAIANADFLLTSGFVADCQRFVDGYWAQFLKLHVPLEANEVAPGELFTPPVSGSPALEGQARRERREERNAEQPEEKPGMMERMRNWWSRPLWR
ncbi:MAG TPA: hypothetical protein VFB96_02520 [Pirellulaceae bacterium]|nr:hypothetical protein [Pirellulaceae bacterium]